MDAQITLKERSNTLNAPFFPENYGDSRALFLSRLGSIGARFDSIPTPCASAGQDEPLHLDFATFGDLNAGKHLVVVAGTHGVEAAVGAAIQLEFASLLQADPVGFAITFVHCLNPWGMAKNRRTNANNVDLNRNCVFEPLKREGAPVGYELSRSLTMPDLPTGFGVFTLKALGKVMRHGYSTMFQSIVGGQYEEPTGLYYGGAELEPELTILEGWMRNHLQGKEQVIVIDIHSGLGRFGSTSVLLDYTRASEQYRRAVKVFGPDLVQAPDSPESLTFETRGALSYLITKTLSDTLIDQFVLEFGTLHPLRVLHALVEESRHYRARPGDRDAPAVRALRHAFCPTSPQWRNTVVSQGLQTLQNAIHFFCLK